MGVVFKPHPHKYEDLDLGYSGRQDPTETPKIVGFARKNRQKTPIFVLPQTPGRYFGVC
jgi:hypothetical protein